MASSGPELKAGFCDWHDEKSRSTGEISWIDRVSCFPNNRKRFMKTLIFAMLAVPIVFGACKSGPPTKPEVERTTDLGFGFRRVVMAEQVNVAFESIGHFEYLYYGNLRLCQVDECSISPSGKYAIYQDGPSGELFLFRREEEKLARLTTHFIGLAESFTWREEANSVEVNFGEGQRVERFRLR